MPPVSQHSDLQTSSSNPEFALPVDNFELKQKFNSAVSNLTMALCRENKQAFYGLNRSGSGVDTLRVIAENVITIIRDAFSTQVDSRKAFGDTRQQLVQNLRSQYNVGNSVFEEIEVEESMLPTPREENHRFRVSTNSLNNNHATQHNPGQNRTSAAHVASTLGNHAGESVRHPIGAFKRLNNAIDGDFANVVGNLRNGLEKSASNSASKPLDYLGKSIVKDGPADVVLAMVYGSAMSPLGIAGTILGAKGLQHSRQELKQLNTKLKDQNKELGSFLDAKQVLPGKLLESKIQAQNIRLEKTQESIGLAQRKKQLSITSMVSGLTVALKGTSTLVLNASLGLKNVFIDKSFFALGETIKYGGAASAAVGFGLASTLVLGPVGGLSALIFGGLITTKTLRKLNQLKTDFTLLKNEMKAHLSSHAEQPDPTTTKLLDFLNRQGEKRIGFFNRFSHWNKSFLVSSGLYASSAITKATVAGLAIAGVAVAASNPIGLAVILSVGLAGTIGLLVSTVGFFRGYRKQEKYSAVTATDHKWVDRVLMTDLHGIKGTKSGFHMGANCLKYLDSQKSLLGRFLNDAAESVNKHSPMEKNLTWWQHWGGRVLNQKEITQFIESSSGQESFKTFVMESLLSKSEMLTEKISQRSAMLSELNAPVRLEEKVETINSDVEKQIMELGNVLEHMDKDLARDQADLELTVLNMKKISTNPDLDLTELASCIDAGKELKTISQFLRRDMDTEIRKARGVLFESQLEGSRLREKQSRNLAKEQQQNVANETVVRLSSIAQGSWTPRAQNRSDV